MKHEIAVNKFKVEFWDDGWPRWVSISYEGKEILHGLHHKEVQDLEYCLSRIRSELRRVTPEERETI
jgi:hypothetical protein